MGKSTSVKREIRFKQWIQQVKEYNERPDGMSMSAWCLAYYLLVVRLSYHQISFFPRSYSYYNRNMHFELIKLLENQELLNECGIYFCTGIYFFKLAFTCDSIYFPLISYFTCPFTILYVFPVESLYFPL